MELAEHESQGENGVITETTTVLKFMEGDSESDSNFRTDTKENTCSPTENEYEYIDVVWLKKDVRWMDHGPLSEVSGAGGGKAFPTREQQRRKFVILYLYEPDQLREHSVHGSHLRFVHEGLVDMEGKLNEPTEVPASERNISSVNNTNDDSNIPSFQHLTVCHNTIISTLNSIHFRYPASSPASVQGENKPKKRKCYKISRLLAHEETGHWQSYMRDRSVRKWCKTRSIPFLEFNQTGVTRRLKVRDDYLKLWKIFMAKPLYSKVDLESTNGRASFKTRLIQLYDLPGFLTSPRGIAKLFDTSGDFDENAIDTDIGRRILGELPVAHRSDRAGRQQFGGETKAKNTLNSFLSERGAKYSQHISSPNSSWNSCSRLSVYLTWGHISLRSVLKALEDRRDKLRKLKTKSTWLKSLQAFASRAHWRSHFVQKLESEPTLEKCDLCPAYQHLRRQDGDWEPQKYTAWETGTTGYPFVDACMRCLIEHGWLNFRMRAMLVSFATYNLWLDWKRIAPHLARVFLDYEPGIHYPQIQMQAGTTGINAMRVYNVTKQGKDQDPKGIFIRRYVPELRHVPDQYIHEPWKMSEALKDKHYKNKRSLFLNTRTTTSENDEDDCAPYPEPIVDEKESARISKEKLNTVKKAVATRVQANQVYIKHGSRSRQSNEMNQRGLGGGALAAVVAIEAGVVARGQNESGHRQPKIKDAFFAAAATTAKKGKSGRIVDLTTNEKTKSGGKRLHATNSTNMLPNTSFIAPTKRLKLNLTTASKSTDGTIKNRDGLIRCRTNATKTRTSSSNANDSISGVVMTSKGSWSCTACTFLNDKPLGLVCSVCGTAR
jgi:deoxyribodipyrimidine photo-lyase